MAEYLIPPVIKLGEHEKDLCCFNGAGTICFEPPCGLPTQVVEWTCEGSTDGCSGMEHTRWSEFAAYTCEGSTDGCSGMEHTRWSEFNLWDCNGVGDDCTTRTLQASYDAETGPPVPGGGPLSGIIKIVNNVPGEEPFGRARLRFATISCCPAEVVVEINYEAEDPDNLGFQQPAGVQTSTFTLFNTRGTHFQIHNSTTVLQTPPSGYIWKWRLLSWSSAFGGSACTNTREAKGEVTYEP